MTLLEYIRADYKEYITLHCDNSELKSALRTHERVPVFLDGLHLELAKHKNLNRDTIKFATYEMTKLFLEMIRKKAQEKLMSDLEKAEAKKKLDEAKAFEEQTQKMSELDQIVIDADKEGVYAYDGEKEEKEKIRLS